MSNTNPEYKVAGRIIAICAALSGESVVGLKAPEASR